MILQIQRERLNRQWTLDCVAKKVGITNQAVSLIETGQRKPYYDVLVKLLDLFGYDDPRKLFEVVEKTKKPDDNQAKTNTIK